MCSRFEAAVGAKKIEETFAMSCAAMRDESAPVKRPTDACWVLRGAECAETKWGLSVSWSPKPIINARSETLLEKSTFRAMLENRCIVPASAYFEWRKTEDHAFKNRISLPEDRLIWMAALYDETSFTILTCKPSEQLAPIHSRMPVILDDQSAQNWLNPASKTAELLGPVSEPSNQPFEIEEELPAVEQLRLF